MKGLLRRRPSPTLGVALVALFISLGGVSYGVATGSIDSREIRNNTVRGKDIRNSTVLSKDVRNGSLLARDFKPGQLPAGSGGIRGGAGPTGQKGEKGNKGDPGAPGKDGVNGVTGYVDATPGTYNNTLSANSGTGVIVATCPAGTRAVGGGFSILNTSATVVEDFQVLHSERASGNPAQWQVWVRNTNDSLARLLSARATAVCVKGS